MRVFELALQCNRGERWLLQVLGRRVRVDGCALGDCDRWVGGGREAADRSNDSWVEVEVEMRCLKLHKQGGIQVMRKVVGRHRNERFRSRGRKQCVHLIHPKSQIFSKDIPLFTRASDDALDQG